MNRRTCIIQHVLRRTVCECRLRKLLNCNSCTSLEITCKVLVELHITYTLTMDQQLVINNIEIINVTTEWA